MKRIGLIGLDTSHVSVFTRLLNDPHASHYVEGAQVTVAYPGGTPSFDLSISRVPGFTEELKDRYGVEMVDTPQAVAERCDLLFITSVDGRVHRRLFEATLAYGRPTFIDKPFATSVIDAEAMLTLAAQSAVPLMSCSALRYADGLQDVLAELKNSIVACTAYGPMEIIQQLPGLYWYGIHTVEMVVATMGPGCTSVQTAVTEHGDVLTLAWGDGRIAVIHGLRESHHKFGITLHTHDNVRFIDPAAVEQRSFYVSLIEAILRSLPAGQSDVAAIEMLEVIRIIDAANRSRDTRQCVTLVPAKAG